jgi:1-acyl-sn-glycerol-3-phosphate acyltransferase
MSPERGASGGLDPRELAELRAAVSALRAQIERRRGFRIDEEAAPSPDRAPRAESRVESLVASLSESLRDVDPLQLFDELRRRLALLGGARSRTPSVDEFGLDAEALENARALLDFLYERWWRVKLSGAERIPDEPGVLFVANRSGILPYDGLMIAHAVERSLPSRRRPRFLVADWLVTLPVFQPLLTRVGGVRACRENAERLLASGASLIAFPEGQKGALKLFRERYRLQRFGRGGFVTLALRHRAPIVPVAVVGAEEAHPVLLRPGLAERLLGMPLPITPTFPHLGPLGLIPLPSQWRIRFGDPVRLEEVPPERADDPLYTNRVREQIRNAVQSLVDKEVRNRAGVWS